jgi:DtxR family Mn-dependent transcriptional regulator
MEKEKTLSDRAQEILEKYWIENKENKIVWQMKIVFDDPVAVELTEGGYVKHNNDSFELTEKGWNEARNCVRRHRLAERLLNDVLDIKKGLLHEIGCRFEHVLQKSVAENICTLLGHPTSCPHGKPIPEGDCCKDNKRKPKKMVMLLSECETNEKAKIGYIKTDEDHIINKLTAMGILPGLDIKLLRKTPSYLFQMGESQFAIDKNLADKIYVRLV